MIWIDLCICTIGTQLGMFSGSYRVFSSWNFAGRSLSQSVWAFWIYNLALIPLSFFLSLTWGWNMVSELFAPATCCQAILAVLTCTKRQIEFLFLCCFTHRILSYQQTLQYRITEQDLPNHCHIFHSSSIMVTRQQIYYTD